MVLSIIVAASENRVIGRDNALIWHVSADLKRFRQLTTGHTVIMGRRTFESIGRALPQRRNIVISRNPDFRAENCEVTGSLTDALKMVGMEDEVFIIGGGSVYNEIWKRADRLYLTLVHTVTEGDTFIPAVGPEEWEIIACQDFKAGEKDDFDYSFIDYRRIKKELM